MSERVLATEVARTAASRMAEVLGGMVGRIRTVKQLGTTLSNPDSWDGPSARGFRSDWPETSATLDRIAQQVEGMQQSSRAIVDAILRAGSTGAVPAALAEPGPALGVVTPPPTAPAQVAMWWARLSPTQQQSLIQTDPQLLASKDGLPADVRNQANEELLTQRIANLEERVDQHQASQDETNELKVDLQLQAMLKSSETPMYLLEFEPAQGHVIVADGNPDQATNTAVFVPGVGSTWDSVPGNVQAVQGLHDRAQLHAPGETVSTVLWIGYDAPPGLPNTGFVNALSANRAVAGAQPLDSFVTGLRSAHEGPPTDLTLIGHSYGSLVVGEAASRDPQPLPVNNIVFVGSPGTGVQNVDQLHLPAGARVYAGTHPMDVPRAASDAPRLSPINLIAHGGEVQGQFGADPTDPQYGATPLLTGGFFSGGGGQDYYHDYLDPAADPVSLDNIALVIAGKGA